MSGGGDDVIDGGNGTDTVNLSGLVSDYTIVAEGIGFRITDLVSDRDGSAFVTNVERVRFGDLTFQTLEPETVIQLEREKGAGAQVLPALPDDDFVFSAKDDSPLVLPGTDDFGASLFGGLTLPQPGLQDNLLVRDGYMLELLPDDAGLTTDLTHGFSRNDGWIM